ncbi:MAG: hypothetical protein AMXMBFR84_19390 [Candidatus Hydrogenedentota bacterium]
MKIAIRGLVWVLALVLVAPVARTEDEFSMEDGILKQDRSPYTLRGIATPDMIYDGMSIVDQESRMNQVARVGGTTVCFDLVGFGDGGKTLSGAKLKLLDEIVALMNYRGMTAIVRVLGPDAPTDRAGRRTAAVTAAKALRGREKCVYVIDGDNASDLIRRFKRNAPRLVVLGSEGKPHVKVVFEPTMTAKGPVLLYGAVPETGHCLMPAEDSSYEAFETVSTHPKELDPWTPDNSVLTEQERAEGFIALFNGRDLDGWIIAGDQECWRVKDGTICWVRQGGKLLRTVKRYSDFILRFEYNMPEGGNSGIHIRAPRAARNSKIGFEFQMMGDYGEAPNKTGTGSIYDAFPPMVNAVKPNGEWNFVEIYLKGAEYKATLNGQVVQDTSFDSDDNLKPRLRDGFIGLTDHSHPVFFRNIRIKPLN